MTSTAKNAKHISVLLEEVMQALLEVKNDSQNNVNQNTLSAQTLWFLDGTLGLAGHSSTLLSRFQQGSSQNQFQAHVVGLDRDPQALTRAQENLAPYKEHVHLFKTDYASYESVLTKISHKDFHGKFHGVLLDLGVSSLQLDVADRGFSYHREGPLNMRMDMGTGEENIDKKDSSSLCAQEFLAKTDFNTLRRVIEEFGEDPQASRIAKVILEQRQREPITNTKQLADIIYYAYPAKWRATARNHPATRTFQAIRMYINDELGQLSRFLDSILKHMEVNAIIAIISFHSLEDRLVKQKFKEWSTDCLCPPHIPKCVCKHQKEARLLTKKPILPSKDECLANPRASSAKLRIAQKI